MKSGVWDKGVEVCVKKKCGQGHVARKHDMAQSHTFTSGRKNHLIPTRCFVRCLCLGFLCNMKHFLRCVVYWLCTEYIDTLPFCCYTNPSNKKMQHPSEKGGATKDCTLSRSQPPKRTSRSSPPCKPQERKKKKVWWHGGSAKNLF